MSDFSIKTISIARQGYGSDAPFVASINVYMDTDTEMRLAIDEQRTLAIIDVVSDLILDSVSANLADLRGQAQQLFDDAEKAKALTTSIPEGEEAEISDA